MIQCNVTDQSLRNCQSLRKCLNILVKLWDDCRKGVEYGLYLMMSHVFKKKFINKTKQNWGS